MIFTCSIVFGQVVSTTLTFSQSEIQLKNWNGFDIVHLENAELMHDTQYIGAPKLPVRLIKFLLPEGVKVDSINVIKNSMEQIAGSYNIYPIQPPYYPDFSEPPPFQEPDSVYYNSFEEYPGNITEVIGEGYIRDLHILDINIYPVTYYPNQGMLNLYTSITIDIYSSTDPDYQPVNRVRGNTDNDYAIKQTILNSVVNPYLPNNIQQLNRGADKIQEQVSTLVVSSVFSPTTLPSVMGSIVEYVIITNDFDVDGNAVLDAEGNVASLVQEFQRLADWKTKTGVPAVVVSVDQIKENYIGVDVQEQIRNFIIDAHLKWGVDWVLLGGDVNIIPARYSKGRYWIAGKIPTDLYYATISGTWNSNGNATFGEDDDNVDDDADIGIGRAPVDTKEEARLFIDKLFTYYRCSLASSLPVPAIYKSILTMAGIWNKVYGWNDYGIRNTYEANLIIAKMSNSQNLDIQQYEMYEYYDEKEDEYSLAYNRKDEDLSREAALNQLNSGNYGIISHMDHSGYYSIGTGTQTGGGAITNSDMDELNNGNKYGILFSVSCSPAAFDYNAVSEKYILNPNGGGIAFMAPSRSIWISNSPLVERFFSNLFDSNNKYKISNILNTSLWLYGNPECKVLYQLLGEPEMSVWTTEPRVLSVSHPTSTINGETEFAVSVTNLPTGEEALVCLKKDNEDYAYAATSGGSITFLFTPDTPGNLQVTVTAHNFEPYEAIVPVEITSEVYLYISQSTIDDDNTGSNNGNGDNNPDAGETIEWDITLKNSGSISANGVIATLTTESSYITIIDGIRNFGDILSGAQTANPSPFVFSIDSSTPDGEFGLLTLSISDNDGNNWVDSKEIQIQSAEVWHTLNMLIDGGDGIQPGEAVGLYIELSNYGGTTAENVTASLTTASPYILTIEDGSKDYGTIAKNESVTNIDDFNFTIISDYAGENIDLTLTIQNEYGMQNGFSFNLTSPTTIVSNVDFIGNFSSIDLTWSPVSQADWYNVYRSEDGGTIFNKVNILPVQGTSYFKDTDVSFGLTYNYYIIYVDSSANESVPSDVIFAWTTEPYLAGWPVMTSKIIRSPITVYDVDGDGDKEIFTGTEGSSKIFGFHHTGEELFDIDWNPTTISGFADGEDGWMIGAPAIKDVDGDGIAEVFGTFIQQNDNPTYYRVYAWSCKDEDDDHSPDPLPGWPVVLNSFAVASPVIADLDYNGTQEIIIFASDLHIFNIDGSSYNPNVWPIDCGYFSGYRFPTPSIGNLDNDQELEIVIAGYNDDGGSTIQAYNLDGSLIFDIEISNSQISSSPVIGDIDGDGDNEIIISVSPYRNKTEYPSLDMIYILNADGSFAPGWETGQDIDNVGEPASSPSLADIDSDGDLEIFMGTSAGISGWDHFGNDLPNFPVAINLDKTSSLTIGDINSDSYLDILVAGDNNRLYAITAHGPNAGNSVVGWPAKISGCISTPALSDLDNDGDIEVIIGDESGNIHVWDAQGNPNSIHWASFQSDAQNTGFYRFSSNQGFETVLAPEVYSLSVGYPNPFNPTTIIPYQLPNDSYVSLIVYDILGREIVRLIEEEIAAGYREVKWNGKNQFGKTVSSGVYIYRISAKGMSNDGSVRTFSRSQKIVLVK